MKKSIIYSGICAVALTSVFATSITATAAPEKTQTDGKASFIIPDGYVDTVKPGTDDSINIEGGKAKSKGVQLLHAPDFDFGENELKAKTDNIDVIHENYTIADDTTKYATPLFVQVGDFSEGPGTKWNVTVNQLGNFKVADEGGHELANTRIRISKETLTNNLNNTNVANMVSGLSFSPEGYAVIPVSTEAEADGLPVITSKKEISAANTTHGTISSVIFKENYDATKYGENSEFESGSRYSDVQLNVPVEDKVQTKEYSTKLEWSLTVEP